MPDRLVVSRPADNYLMGQPIFALQAAPFLLVVFYNVVFVGEVRYISLIRNMHCKKECFL